MKTTAETVKPFNAEHQRAGAPYRCFNGFEAKILEWIGNRAIGYFRNVSSDVFPAMWDESGVEEMAVTHARAHNLLMTPLSFIDGKPVFMGDLLQGNAGQPVGASMDMAFNEGHAWRWPTAAPVVETKMTDKDLNIAGNPNQEYSGRWCVEARNVANAAIVRALADEQVITLSDHMSSLKARFDELYAQQAAQRAARDMAVAQAVREACAREATKVFEKRTKEMQLCTMPLLVDLTAVVTGVK